MFGGAYSWSLICTVLINTWEAVALRYWYFMSVSHEAPWLFEHGEDTRFLIEQV